jgi:hypothetical protein
VDRKADCRRTEDGAGYQRRAQAIGGGHRPSEDGTSFRRPNVGDAGRPSGKAALHLFSWPVGEGDAGRPSEWTARPTVRGRRRLSEEGTGHRRMAQAFGGSAPGEELKRRRPSGGARGRHRRRHPRQPGGRLALGLVRLLGVHSPHGSSPRVDWVDPRVSPYPRQSLPKQFL